MVVTGCRADESDTTSSSTCSSWRCGTRRSRARSSVRCNPRADIPSCSSMYREGQLKLDELITKPLRARRDQRGLPGHARRQEHPRRHQFNDMIRRDSVDRLAGQIVGRASRGRTGRRRARGRPARPARRARRARAKSTLLRAVAGELGIGLRVRRRQRRADPGAPRRPLRSGAGADRRLRPRRVRRRAAGLGACATASLLYVEEINRIPEETLNVLITVMSEGELHVPRLGRSPRRQGSAWLRR